MKNDMHVIEKKDGLFKLTIPLPLDAWHGFESESVWAEALDDGVMRILNTPFFAKGISYKDLVSIKIGPEVIWFDSVIAKSGHSTYRIVLNDSTDDVIFKSRWMEIATLGCTYESFIDESMNLYAIDIPPGSDVRKVYVLLEAGEKDGVWDFDEGDFTSTGSSQNQ